MSKLRVRPVCRATDKSGIAELSMESRVKETSGSTMLGTGCVSGLYICVTEHIFEVQPVKVASKGNDHYPNRICQVPLFKPFLTPRAMSDLFSKSFRTRRTQFGQAERR